MCHNFLFHTPLPKASIPQLMNEEKGEIINEKYKYMNLLVYILGEINLYD